MIAPAMQVFCSYFFPICACVGAAAFTGLLVGGVVNMLGYGSRGVK